MYLINESPYLFNLLNKKTFIDPSIKVLCTKGFINDYSIIEDKIIFTPRNEEFIDFLSKINNDIIVIATDLDEAGDFIAFEILEFLNKNNTILRLKVNFDDLLNYEHLTKENLLILCDDKINFSNAERFWNNYVNKQEKIEYINVIYKDLYNSEIEL